MPKVVGIDLAVPGRGRTGLAAVSVTSSGLKLIDYTCTQRLEDVTAYVNQYCPHIVAIDAPLSLPRGAKGFREAERWAMKTLGARFLPLTFTSMRRLAYTGISLYSHIVPCSVVVETHPSSALRIAGADTTAQFLKCVGLHPLHENLPRDIVDAIIAAATAALIHRGEALLYGSDAVFIFPLPGLCRRSEPR